MNRILLQTATEGEKLDTALVASGSWSGSIQGATVRREIGRNDQATKATAVPSLLAALVDDRSDCQQTAPNPLETGLARWQARRGG